jgi:alpha-glucosidase
VQPVEEGRLDVQAAPDWWRGGVGYQVYLRSFADADGDGIGDLRGLHGRLDHVAQLGVDLVWITPFYASPQADHGYDVVDHCAVDPVYGTLDDFDAVVGGLHDRGIRLMIDVVPNHTSNRHPWFVDALSGRQARHRNRYIWRDPAPDGGPPNNWVSKFGGPAWTWHEPTGQYYLHSFLPEQPDLNWHDPLVRAEFERILRFWLDRGVDGFRVDAAHLLFKAPELRDNLQLRPVDDDTDPEGVYDAFEHVHDLDQDEVVELYRSWRRIAHERGAVLLGEVVLTDRSRVARYVTKGGLDLTFDFPALKVPWDARAIREGIDATLLAGGAVAWPLSSHDDPRAAERFGGGPLGAQRSLSYLALLCALPGLAFLLQGDELGLDHGVLAAARDPLALRNPGVAGRDGSRTPVPWDETRAFGFTRGEPWLPFPLDRTSQDSVAAQAGRSRSWLERTRALFRAREVFRDASDELRWVAADDQVVAFLRGDTLVATSTSDRLVEVQVPTSACELSYSSDTATTLTGDRLRLGPDATAYVQLDRC